MTLTTKFDWHERVLISALEDCWGTVMEISYTGHIEYKVRYFDSGEQKTVWLLESELSNKEVKKEIALK